MILSKRLVAVPALAAAFAGLTLAPAHATTDALSTDAVNALAVASCQASPTTPLTLAQLAPVVLGESDVTIVPGELTAHVVRAQVNTTTAGDPQECDFGVVHRDALLPQVQYEGTATLAQGATTAATDIEIGNMGYGGPVDPTTAVPLTGFLTPLGATTAPTYSFSIERKARETVTIAVDRADEDAAGKLLKAETKAAAHLQKRQAHAARAKHSAKALAAANKAYAKRLEVAHEQYNRATEPKTVNRPVEQEFNVQGSVPLAG